MKNFLSVFLSVSAISFAAFGQIKWDCGKDSVGIQNLEMQGTSASVKFCDKGRCEVLPLRFSGVQSMPSLADMQNQTEDAVKVDYYRYEVFITDVLFVEKTDADNANSQTLRIRRMLSGFDKEFICQRKVN